MTKKRFDIPRLMRAADELLERTEKPLHRAILQNYRRHALLEISGRWQEILNATMMTEVPHYRFMGPGGTQEFRGLAEIESFYRGYADAGLTVFGSVDDSEVLAVDDWGLMSESTFGHIMPGQVMGSMGFAVDDPSAHYLVTHFLAMAWPYDATGRCAGERIYDDVNSYKFEKLAPEDVVTQKQAASIIAGLLETRTFTPLHSR
jgi:hypothetical protein